LKSIFATKFWLVYFKRLKKKINFLSFKKGNYFPPLEGKLFALKNDFPSFIGPNNGKLKKYFSPNQTLL